jgi:hypothetical protein
MGMPGHSTTTTPKPPLNIEILERKKSTFNGHGDTKHFM